MGWGVFGILLRFYFFVCFFLTYLSMNKIYIYIYLICKLAYISARARLQLPRHIRPHFMVSFSPLTALTTMRQYYYS